MRRREFITVLGGAATMPALWPFTARAQQSAMPVVGYLGPGDPESAASRLAAFRKGLGEQGFVEDRNVKIEFRWAHGDYTRVPDFAADVVRRQVSAIVAPGSATMALAAKAATATIPIVFSTSADPVEVGLVASLNRPGGNVTGVASMGTAIEGKQLGLLHELLPNARDVAVLVNPTGRNIAESTLKQAESFAASLGQHIEVFNASNNREIDQALTGMVQKRAEALLVTPSILFTSRRVQIATLAARHALPALYWEREYVEVGGLMSYGTSATEVYRQVGSYTGRILKGEKPADLPVIQPTTFEFIINLQTARTLGLEVPATLLARADEVIE